MKKYWTGVFGQVRAQQKRFVRDKMSLFFTFLFPLIFLLVFGSIFNNQSTSFDIAIINNSQTEFAKGFVKGAKDNAKDSILKIKDVKDMDEAREKLKRSELNGIIELPSDFGKVKGEGKDARPTGTINVLYAKGSEQTGSALTAVMNQIANEINKHLGQPEAPLKAAGKAVGDEQLKSFDYTFTGLLGFSLMSMGIFGLANQMPAEKQRGSYRRLRAAPFTSGQLIISMAIHYVIISLLSLTFDDGPGPYTAHLLDILDQYSAKATFFLIGSKVSGQASVVRNIQARGHQLGNHSWSHPELPKLSVDQIAGEIDRTNEAIRQATGVKPNILRPPYGAANGVVLEQLRARGMSSILWSVDTRDWADRNSQIVCSRAVAGARPGAVILMHDIHQTSVNAVPCILSSLKQQGYSFVTIQWLN